MFRVKKSPREAGCDLFSSSANDPLQSFSSASCAAVMPEAENFSKRSPLGFVGLVGLPVRPYVAEINIHTGFRCINLCFDNFRICSEITFKCQ